MLSIIGVIMFAPRSWGGSIFGATWPLAAGVLLPVAVARMAGGLGTGPLAGLRAMSATRASFRARSSGAVVGLILTLLGGLFGGVWWAAWGMATGAVLTILLLWHQLIREARRVGAVPQPELAREASQRPSVLWITNIPVPYRVPVWRRLTAYTDLHVCFQAHSEPNRGWDLSDDLQGISHTFSRALRLPGASTPLYLPSRRVAEALRSRQWDLVVIDGWESPAYWQARVLARRGGVPVLAMYRSTLQTRRFVRGPIAMLRRWFLRSCLAVVTAGEASLAAVRADGVASERVFSVFNPVDVDRISAEATAARATGRPRRGHHYLVVGQLIGRKNVESILTAFAAAAEGDDSLSLAGVGPLESDLRCQVRRLGLEGRVTFLGSVAPSEMGGLYGRSSTLVLASTEEVWGLVVNEALAAGIHAVVSEAAGVAESVRAMPGVFVSVPTSSALEAALRASRAAWTGPIHDPQILAHGPAALTDVILGTVAGELQGASHG